MRPVRFHAILLRIFFSIPRICCVEYGLLLMEIKSFTSDAHITSYEARCQQGGGSIPFTLSPSTGLWRRRAWYWWRRPPWHAGDVVEFGGHPLYNLQMGDQIASHFDRVLEQRTLMGLKQLEEDKSSSLPLVLTTASMAFTQPPRSIGILLHVWWSDLTAEVNVVGSGMRLGPGRHP